MDLNELKRLAGIEVGRGVYPDDKVNHSDRGSNPSYTAMEKRKIEREKNIKPGTDEWFQLWFSRPYLTNEKPTTFRGRRR